MRVSRYPPIAAKLPSAEKAISLNRCALLSECDDLYTSPPQIAVQVQANRSCGIPNRQLISKFILDGRITKTSTHIERGDTNDPSPVNRDVESIRWLPPLWTDTLEYGSPPEGCKKYNEQIVRVRERLTLRLDFNRSSSGLHINHAGVAEMSEKYWGRIWTLLLIEVQRLEYTGTLISANSH